jgi:hypothetical protein
MNEAIDIRRIEGHQPAGDLRRLAAGEVTPEQLQRENAASMDDEEPLRQSGVKVEALQGKECIRLMREFIAAKFQLWNGNMGVKKLRSLYA